MSKYDQIDIERYSPQPSYFPAIRNSIHDLFILVQIRLTLIPHGHIPHPWVIKLKPTRRCMEKSFRSTSRYSRNAQAETSHVSSLMKILEAGARSFAMDIVYLSGGIVSFSFSRSNQKSFRSRQTSNTL